jgi:hypothetical protein
VKKAANRAELQAIAKALFEESDLILAQEFMYTKFDWRIGVLNGQPIFACKYRMARYHWQVIKHQVNGTVRMGSSDTIPVDQAPAAVTAMATKAAGLIGNGLYGVDIKETPRGALPHDPERAAPPGRRAGRHQGRHAGTTPGAERRPAAIGGLGGVGRRGIGGLFAWRINRSSTRPGSSRFDAGPILSPARYRPAGN